MVANGNHESDPEKAAAIAIIGKKLTEATDNGFVREVECDNCESIFLVRDDGPVVFWERKNNCDRPMTEVNYREVNDWILNLNPTYIPARVDDQIGTEAARIGASHRQAGDPDFWQSPQANKSNVANPSWAGQSNSYAE